MSRGSIIFAVILSSIAAYEIYSLYSYEEIPTLDPDPWWATGPKGNEDISIREFKINVTEKDLKDLDIRLNLPLRLTPPLEGVNFTYGFNTNTLKKIIDHWRSNYNWRKREANLNKFNHYKTKIEGLDIHFIRAKSNASSDVTIRPLLLLHGWPGSFVEFVDIIPMLTSPQKGAKIAFEIIAPSIPGYGFSDCPKKAGLGVPQTAQIYLKLMKRLGFDKFYVHGGDWGSLITNTMGTLYDDNVLGMHLTMVALNTRLSTIKYIMGSILPSGTVMEKTRESYLYPIMQHLQYIFEETGYLHLQVTKPDTIGIALSQSPEGLAAYILEKFSSWTYRNGPSLPDGGFYSNFPICLDKMLDNINIYWFTRSITTSMRLYAELSQYTKLKMDQIPTMTPTGLTLFENEIYMAPKSFVVEKYHNLVSYTINNKGGHFASMELPQLLADEIINFVNLVEKTIQKSEL